MSAARYESAIINGVEKRFSIRGWVRELKKHGRQITHTTIISLLDNRMGNTMQNIVDGAAKYKNASGKVKSTEIARDMANWFNLRPGRCDKRFERRGMVKFVY